MVVVLQSSSSPYSPDPCFLHYVKLHIHDMNCTYITYLYAMYRTRDLVVLAYLSHGTHPKVLRRLNGGNILKCFRHTGPSHSTALRSMNWDWSLYIEQRQPPGSQFNITGHFVCAKTIKMKFLVSGNKDKY